MKILNLLLTLLILGLSGCAFHDGFPKDIMGDLKPINSQKVMRDVGP